MSFNFGCYNLFSSILGSSVDYNLVFLDFGTSDLAIFISLPPYDVWFLILFTDSFLGDNFLFLTLSCISYVVWQLIELARIIPFSSWSSKQTEDLIPYYYLSLDITELCLILDFDLFKFKVTILFFLDTINLFSFLLV